VSGLAAVAFLLGIGRAQLRLTLDAHKAPLTVTRNARIEFEVTVHKPPGPQGEVERPEVAARNQMPGYFDHHPGPNVELHVVRVDGTRRVDVPFGTYTSGSGASVDTESTFVSVSIETGREAQMARLNDCVTAAKLDPKLVGYISESLVDNPPGTYEITATYRATAWGRGVPPITSPPLRVVVEDGPNQFQQMCERLSSLPKKP
jgi:hypothetical protein